MRDKDRLSLPCPDRIDDHEGAAGRHQAFPAVRINPEILVLCHGGPIAEPGDAAYVLERTEGVAGFFGASSMERLPTEVAMTETLRRFKALALNRPRR